MPAHTAHSAAILKNVFRNKKRTCGCVPWDKFKNRYLCEGGGASTSGSARDELILNPHSSKNQTPKGTPPKLFLGRYVSATRPDFQVETEERRLARTNYNQQTSPAVTWKCPPETVERSTLRFVSFLLASLSRLPFSDCNPRLPGRKNGTSCLQGLAVLQA
jgi:hypothetical protein